jgi:hypothetical protein
MYHGQSKVGHDYRQTKHDFRSTIEQLLRNTSFKLLEVHR